jgi:hypothetical protein
MSNMSVKKFLFKAGTKAANSASEFINNHRSFLMNDEMFGVVGSIVNRFDARELLPTPALSDIKAAVLSYQIQNEVKKAEAKILADKAKETNKVPKNYVASIYSADGNLVIEKPFDMPQDGMRFLDRQLADGSSASDYFGVLLSTKIIIKGEYMAEVVLRQDALARILKAGKSPFMKKMGVSNSSISWGVKAKQTKSVFSGG